jgi:hypothetical protein
LELRVGPEHHAKRRVVRIVQQVEAALDLRRDAGKGLDRAGDTHPAVGSRHLSGEDLADVDFLRVRSTEAGNDGNHGGHDQQPDDDPGAMPAQEATGNEAESSLDDRGEEAEDQ